MLRDQDAADCKKVKRLLTELCVKAGKSGAIIRIACRELESFYLGDLRAVERGLQIAGLAEKQDRAKYRDPDRLSAPSRELDALTKGRYQKVSGSRAIAPHLDLNESRSKSFRHLLQSIRQASQS